MESHRLNIYLPIVNIPFPDLFVICVNIFWALNSHLYNCHISHFHIKSHDFRSEFRLESKQCQSLLAMSGHNIRTFPLHILEEEYSTRGSKETKFFEFRLHFKSTASGEGNCYRCTASDMFVFIWPEYIFEAAASPKVQRMVDTAAEWEKIWMNAA